MASTGITNRLTPTYGSSDRGGGEFSRDDGRFFVDVIERDHCIAGIRHKRIGTEQLPEMGENTTESEKGGNKNTL